LSDRFALETVWQLEKPQLVDSVKDFWIGQGIPPAVTIGRAGQICAVATEVDSIVAVSTATPYYHQHMRNKFFVYRCMVAPAARQQNLAWKISSYSLKILQDWSERNPQEKVLGLIICVETDKFTAGLRRPVREKYGFNMHFVGYSANGQQLRVVWFDHAELDDSAIPHHA